MSLLTPEYLAKLYTTFAKLPPFDKYALPNANAIEWKVIKDKRVCGYFYADPLRIEISSSYCKKFRILSETILHEMIHLALYHCKRYEHYDEHKVEFYKLAVEVCKVYGFEIRKL